MSILSQLIDKKISFSTAETEAGQWFQNLVSKNPTLQANIQQAESDLKQGFSNAIALGETALGPILSGAAIPIETAINGALTGVTGGAGAIAAPAVDAGVALAIQFFHTLVDELGTQAQAALNKTTSGG